MKRFVHRSYLFLRLLIILIDICTCIPIDNGVEGEPKIECEAGYIAVTFLLRNNFDGHVYVKGHHNESQCKTDQTGTRMANIRLSFNSCGVQRTRSLNPKGIYVGTVIVITFHQKFITKVDRAYATQCFYMEAEKSVNVQLEVSELTTIFQTKQVPMPVCRYEVLDGSLNGPSVRYTIVGQQVYHKWTCDTDTVGIFCMYVNSCYVSDGYGEQVEILDSAGCSIDRYVLQNLEYINDLMAGQEAHVFKFADRNTLYFQCQIAITIREPTSACPRPQCGASAAVYAPGPAPPAPVPPYVSSARFIESANVSSGEDLVRIFNSSRSHSTRDRSHRRSQRSPNLDPDQDTNVWDVRAPAITAFDVDADGGPASKFYYSTQSAGGRENQTSADDQNLYCMHMSTFVSMVSAALISTFALAMALLIYCMRNRRSKQQRLY